MLTDEQINELTLTKYPNPVLRQPARKIEKLDTWVEKLALKMIELMYECHGMGLAGNQAGLDLQIFVGNPIPDERGNEIVMINPVIVDAAGWTEVEEGCLSLPEIYSKIRRQKRVIVTATDLAGNEIEHDCTNVEARLMQHEIDHLNGKMIIDRMSPLAKLGARYALKQLENEAK